MKQLVVLWMILLFPVFSFSEFTIIQGKKKVGSLKIKKSREVYNKQDCFLYIFENEMIISKTPSEIKEKTIYYEYVDFDFKPLSIMIVKKKAGGLLTDTIEGKITDSKITLTYNQKWKKEIHIPGNFLFFNTLSLLSKKIKNSREYIVFNEDSMKFQNINIKNITSKGDQKLFLWEIPGTPIHKFLAFYKHDKLQRLIDILNSKELINDFKEGHQGWLGESSKGMIPELFFEYNSEISEMNIQIKLKNGFTSSFKTPNSRIQKRETLNPGLMSISRNKYSIDLPDNLKKYSENTKYITEKIRLKAREIIGNLINQGEIVKKISNFCRTKIEVANTSDSFRRPENVLLTKRGTKSEISLLFNTMLKASGIFVNDCFGIVYENGEFYKYIWSNFNEPGFSEYDMFSSSKILPPFYFKLWEGQINNDLGIVDIERAEKVLDGCSIYVKSYKLYGKYYYPENSSPVRLRIGNGYFSKKHDFSFFVKQPGFEFIESGNNSLMLKLSLPEKKQVNINISVRPTGFFENITDLFAYRQNYLRNLNNGYMLYSSSISLQSPQRIIFSYFWSQHGFSSKYKEAIFLGEEFEYYIDLSFKNMELDEAEPYFDEIIRSFKVLSE